MWHAPSGLFVTDNDKRAPPAFCITMATDHTADMLGLPTVRVTTTTTDTKRHLNHDAHWIARYPVRAPHHPTITTPMIGQYMLPGRHVTTRTPGCITPANCTLMMSWCEASHLTRRGIEGYETRGDCTGMFRHASFDLRLTFSSTKYLAGPPPHHDRHHTPGHYCSPTWRRPTVPRHHQFRVAHINNHPPWLGYRRHGLATSLVMTGDQPGTLYATS